MNLQIVQRKDGMFGIFFHEGDSWVADGLSREDVVKWFALYGEDVAKETLKALENGELPYGGDALSYEDLDTVFWKLHGEGAKKKTS